jgi:hypothetical protein
MDASLHYNIWLYTCGYIKLETLEDWYVPKLESLINDPNTVYIVAQLELQLAELSDGLQTEEELKNNLKTMIRNDLNGL